MFLIHKTDVFDTHDRCFWYTRQTFLIHTTHDFDTQDRCSVLRPNEEWPTHQRTTRPSYYTTTYQQFKESPLQLTKTQADKQHNPKLVEQHDKKTVRSFDCPLASSGSGWYAVLRTALTVAILYRMITNYVSDYINILGSKIQSRKNSRALQTGFRALSKFSVCSNCCPAHIRGDIQACVTKLANKGCSVCPSLFVRAFTLIKVTATDGRQTSCFTKPGW